MLAWVLLIAANCGAIASETSHAIVDRVPRVLILYPYDERLVATTVAGEALRTRLLEATDGRIDLFSEFLDLSRFPEAEHVARMVRYMAEKYASRRPDVVVALGKESASLISTNRGTIAPDAKIIFCGFNSCLDFLYAILCAFSISTQIKHTAGRCYLNDIYTLLVL